jgi:hypothetical protein
MRTLELTRVSIEIPYIDIDDSAGQAGFLGAILFVIGALVIGALIRNPIPPQPAIHGSDFLFSSLATVAAFIFGGLICLITRAIKWKKFRNNFNVLGTRAILELPNKEIKRFKNSVLNLCFPMTGDVTSDFPHSTKPERPIVAVRYKGKYLLFETI